jgi:hypothetical protein
MRSHELGCGDSPLYLPNFEYISGVLFVYGDLVSAFTSMRGNAFKFLIFYTFPIFGYIVVTLVS